LQLLVGLHGPMAAPITTAEEIARKKSGFRSEYPLMVEFPSSPLWKFGETATRENIDMMKAPHDPKYPFALSVVTKSPKNVKTMTPAVHQRKKKVLIKLIVLGSVNRSA